MKLIWTVAMLSFVFPGSQFVLRMWAHDLQFHPGMNTQYQVYISVFLYLVCVHVISAAGPRRGIPNVVMHRNNQTTQIDPSFLPEAEDALQLFEANGGHITVFSPFGEDPLASHPDLAEERESTFLEYFPDFGPFFHTVVNGNTLLFSDGLLCFIHISKQLEIRCLH